MPAMYIEAAMAIDDGCYARAFIISLRQAFRRCVPDSASSAWRCLPDMLGGDGALFASPPPRL